jgi:two-component system response regulator YesN
VSHHIPTNKETVEQVKAILLADLSRTYSIPELAALAGITAFTLKRIFKKEEGQSLVTFYRTARMNKAKELLRTTNETIQMIAEAVGYTEGNNFQNTFKRVTSCTPGEWRKQAQNLDT